MEAQTSHLLMADLVDYTRLMESDRDRTIGLVRELRDTHLEPVVARFHGDLLKRMGDGWIFSFGDEASATEAALEVQRGLAHHEAIRMRMACHSAEVLHDEADFYGPGVNLTQRIMTEAPPGGVMISQDLHRQLPLSLASGFRDAGSFRLKNIAAPVTLYQWRPDDSGSQRLDEVPGIAIEPFSFAPDDTDTRSAAGDLREQLMLRLSRRTGIRVLDDSTGRARNPTYLLHGRLRVAGNRARLSLTLVVAADSTTVWSQNYEGDPSDIFAFCDDIIERADVDLRLQINAFDGERVAHLPPDRLSLSELRSRAASAFYGATLESWQEAHGLLERASRLSPDDPMTVSMLAEGSIMLMLANYREPTPEWISTFEQRVNHAVEQVPRSDYAVWVRALFRLHILRDLQGAASDLQRTMVLSPSYVPGFELQGVAAMAAGRWDEAVSLLDRAVSLSNQDPLLPYRLYLLAAAHCCRGTFEEARVSIERGHDMRPDIAAFSILGAIARASDIQEAKAAALGYRGPKRASVMAPRLTVPPAHEWLNEAMRPDPEETDNV